MDPGEIMLICPEHPTERIQYICTNTSCSNHLACKTCCSLILHSCHREKIRILKDFLSDPKPILSLSQDHLAFLSSFGPFKNELDNFHKEMNKRLNEQLENLFSVVLEKVTEFQNAILKGFQDSFTPFVENINKIEYINDEIKKSFLILFQKYAVPGGPSQSSLFEIELNALLQQHNDPLILLDLESALKAVISQRKPQINFEAIQSLLDNINKEIESCRKRVLITEINFPGIDNSSAKPKNEQKPTRISDVPAQLTRAVFKEKQSKEDNSNTVDLSRNFKTLKVYKDSPCCAIQELGNFLFTLNQEMTSLNVFNIESGQRIWNFNSSSEFDNFDIDRSEFELYTIDNSDKIQVFCLKKGEILIQKTFKFKISSLLILNETDIAVVKKGSPRAIEIWNKIKLEPVSTITTSMAEISCLCRLSDSFFAYSSGKKVFVYAGAASKYEIFQEVNVINKVTCITLLTPLKSFAILTESHVFICSFPEIEITYRMSIPPDFYNARICGGMSGSENGFALIKDDSISFFFDDGQRERTDKISSVSKLNGIFMNQANKFFFALENGDVIVKEFSFR